MTKKTRKMTSTIRKFTKVKGTEIRVYFKDLISRKEFYYSKNLKENPTAQDRQDFLNEVLYNCNFISTTGLKPIK